MKRVVVFGLIITSSLIASNIEIDGAFASTQIDSQSNFANERVPKRLQQKCKSERLDNAEHSPASINRPQVIDIPTVLPKPSVSTKNIDNNIGEQKEIVSTKVVEQTSSNSTSELNPKEWVDGMSNIQNTPETKKSYLQGILEGVNYGEYNVDGIKLKYLLKKFYMQRDFETYWIGSNYDINPNLFEMIDAIKKAPSEALDSKKYHLDEIAQVLSQIKQGVALSNRDRNLAVVKLDLLLSDAFFLMAKDLHEGEIDFSRFKEILAQKKEEEKINYKWDLPLKGKNYVSFLQSLENSSNFQKELFDLSPSNDMINSLKDQYQRYKDIELQGGWQPIPRGKKLRVGSIDKKRVLLLAKRLLATGDFDEYDFNSSKMTKSLSNALKHYQNRVGLWGSGVLTNETRRSLNITVQSRINLIKLNISRLRADIATYDGEYILVNIPEFMMHFFRDGQEVMSMKVVVGRKKNPTPIFSSNFTYFELNPYWNVPESIVKKEMLPKLQNDPDYLMSRKFKMYNGWNKNRKEIDSFDIDWYQYDEDSHIPFSFVRLPGRGNPLGFVKFMFPNKHAVYMHDTPDKKFFKRRVRAYSHGCIRLSRPKDLLDYIVSNYASQDQNGVERAEQSGENESFKLDYPIPVNIRYITAFVRDGVMNFRGDIYDYDKIQLNFMN